MALKKITNTTNPDEKGFCWICFGSWIIFCILIKRAEEEDGDEDDCRAKVGWPRLSC